MATEIERGRDALLAWEAGKPQNFFTWDENLARVLSVGAVLLCCATLGGLATIDATGTSDSGSAVGRRR